MSERRTIEEQERVASAELEALARRAGEELEEASAEEIIRWAVDQFGDRLCLASSMQDAVLVHLASRVRPGIDVLFLDTGYHFAETIGTRDAVEAVYDVNLITVRPELTVAEQDERYGPRLYERDPDRCCALRKVAPLNKALEPYDAWLTGLRRAESPTRANTKVVDWDAKRGKVKIAPIARWTDDDVAAYVAEHGVLLNPLLMDGYASIGCAPCTRRVAAGEDPRSGRWAGFAKTECGIHT
ncbi:phosphoadenylyl-sulfate reductase [Carbonactinospora thermoautotrophica]|uniref:Adenosine 5'-phosphosulfate reductase n=1 Tax=Carbonactinospora thermoautotrophica TaxID=1469144 RepID=A0A132MQ52_9ACTN|nr:phosphoadenylyl-sulfate reductase [Carbonactinospora thermoautotrophica]KWW99996.1 Phosphoadenylyl-sulfate reductase (thioredoxin) [Carbonactinospora thermoautotrophica]